LLYVTGEDSIRTPIEAATADSSYRTCVADHKGFNTARAVGVIPVLQDPEFVSYALRSPLCQSFINERANTTAPALGRIDTRPLHW
jgi:hypothetical protein